MDKKVKEELEEFNEDNEKELEEEEIENTELEELQHRAEEFETKYKRALADYQNLEKRVSEQRLELIRGANKDLLLRILTVLDTLELAQQHVADKNIEVSINHFLDVLKAEGVTKIKTVGEKFDPERMEAISVVSGDEGKVVNEVRSGFMLHDKLLRAAQVTVGSGKN